MTRLHIFLWILTLMLLSSPALAVYSPELGRFRTRDPAGYVDGSHRQGYLRGNPTRFADPYGLWKLNFSDNVSDDDRERVQEAVNKACSKVRDANDAINNASPCAQKHMEEKYGDEWSRTRNKLTTMQRECDSKKTSINIDVGPDPDNDSFAWYQWKRRHVRNSPDDPEYPREHFITLNNDRDGPGSLDPGDPGNTWHDNPVIAPSRLLLHELFHVIERITGDEDRDDTHLLDDPRRLELLDIGVDSSRIGMELRHAEACCAKDR